MKNAAAAAIRQLSEIPKNGGQPMTRPKKANTPAVATSATGDSSSNCSPARRRGVDELPGA